MSVDRQNMHILVVTGVSGGGKTTALRALEDVGYYCVDNLPLPLLSRFVQLVETTGHKKIALVMDAREGEFLASFRQEMRELREKGHALEVLFLDAPDDVLLRRFSETRRRHPLRDDDLRQAIAHERQTLLPLREEAHAVVDTGELNVHQLKGVIQERYGRSNQALSLTLLSFGFKFGLPVEADLVLDVRFLPNPYFVPELAHETGLNATVSEFVLRHPDAQAFIAHALSLIEFYLPRAEREGKSYVTVAIGCTGGRHRSVAVVGDLFNRLGQQVQITVRHRELGRGREP
ncbi:MAG TPA: RNase adapter RapZ [Pseudomonadota bacterium]|nr:RNase adapter RapZ [Pseudomonadota bacterium]